MRDTCVCIRLFIYCLPVSDVRGLSINRQSPFGEVFISKLTLAALEDIGYIVDPSKVRLVGLRTCVYACVFLTTEEAVTTSNIKREASANPREISIGRCRVFSAVVY